VTLARWSVANDLPRVPSLERFYPTATERIGGGGGIEVYLPTDTVALGSNVEGGNDAD
jgi:hypothetical protein